MQIFQGVVIRVQGSGGRTFTVRKVSFGVGVERTFPLNSPIFEQIEIVTRGDVRRAKLYYLRNLRGKAAKIKERREAWRPAPRCSLRSARDHRRPRPRPSSNPTRRGRGLRARKKHLPVWQETILLLAIALALAVVIKALFVQAFYIPSESMEPGLVKNDRILVEKVSYWFGAAPARGRGRVPGPRRLAGPRGVGRPQGGLTQLMATIGLYPSGGHLVKRVIGVAGDTIECCDEEGRISVNGQPLDETTSSRPAPTATAR